MADPSVDPLLLLAARAACLRRKEAWAVPVAAGLGAAGLGAAAAYAMRPARRAAPAAQASQALPATKPARFVGLRDRLRRWIYGNTERAVGDVARRFDQTYYPGPR